MGWLSFILGALDPIEKITQAIVKARADSINATTDQERISADERVKTLQARRDVLIAEAGVSRANMIVRCLLAAPVMAVLWKLMLWDKVVGSLAGCSQAVRGTCGRFTTDPLDDNQWKIISVVLGFYFLYEGAIGVTRIIKR